VTRPLSLTTDPLLTSMIRGDRPETWYLPGGNCTENLPEGPARTLTRRCPAAVKVTVPGMGRQAVRDCPAGTKARDTSHNDLTGRVAHSRRADVRGPATPRQCPA